ncbi:MAG: T9SS type A sorting domain-containing protein, partial [Bacteroidales bacterium]
SISWSMGEVETYTLEGNNIILMQGFQQPYDLEVGMKENRINRNILVYPNPAEDELTIVFRFESPDDYLIEFRDIAGRLIKQQSQRQIRTGESTILNISSFKRGVYFLKILDADRKPVYITSILKI